MFGSPASPRGTAARSRSPLARVLPANLALIARSGRTEAYLFVLATWLLCGWAASLVRGVPAHSYVDRQLGMYFVTLVFAACWPLVVWRDEAPRQRAYLRSLPLPPGAGTLVRVLAGLGVLLAAVVLANAGGFVIGAAIGRAAEFGAVTPLAWLASGLGLTIVYLIASAIAVASDTPGPWTLALVALVYAPPLMLPLPEPLLFAIRPGPTWLYQGAFGFDRATRFAVTQAQLDSRLSEFTPDQWLPAALVWLGFACAFLWLASRRRVDL